MVKLGTEIAAPLRLFYKFAVNRIEVIRSDSGVDKLVDVGFCDTGLDRYFFSRKCTLPERQ